MLRCSSILQLALAILLSHRSVLAQPNATATIEFNRDIRPILSENCYYCHGPDPKHRKAKLRLDVRQEALDKQAIVPGKPEDSSLIERILTHDPDDLMPPPESHKVLKPAQKELLKAWIAAGAEYQSHWAYNKVQRPQVPVLPASPDPHPIDAFIQHKLRAKSAAPSAEASRARLLRRVSLDLTGLPPTPAQLQDFAADRGSNAFGRQVERLLQSPHYGERMAVGWLDAVRFSDTVGYHGDQNQNIFPYRDYVIDSFNRNKPFSDFTIEQIAGDLLTRSSIEQLIATGFNRLNMVTREGGAQPGEYLAKYAADRVRTVGITWLGSTIGCAECHDHKFDPFTSKDFYSLGAFFADVKQWGVYSDYTYTPNPDLKDWSNDHPFPPEIEVESPYLLQRRAGIETKLSLVLKDFADRTAARARPRALWQDWRKSGLAFLKVNPSGWFSPPVEVSFPVATNKSEKAESNKDSETKADKPRARVLPGQIIGFEGETSDSAEFHLKPGQQWIAAIRIELIPDPTREHRLFRASDRSPTLQLAVRHKRAGSTNESKISILHADAPFKEKRFADGAEVIGIKSGWKISAQHAHAPQSAIWVLDPPVNCKSEDELIVVLKRNLLAQARVSVSPFAARNPLESGEPNTFAEVLRASPRSAAAAEAFLLGTASDQAAYDRAKELMQASLECRDGRSPTLVTAAWEPRPMRVLPRGNWQDQSGAAVQPGTPEFLPAKMDSSTRRLTRLDLARWLVSRDNPLTARVIMNRLWKQFFGTGLSSTVDDFGAQGESPVHPELLDWLAAEFMDSGWDFKHMVRLIVTSAVYKQDSRARSELKDFDPNNRWLAYHPPRRLEAEFVRDNALFAAGLLALDVGGPSARPYQPPGYYANLQFPDRDYVAHTDDRQYRRGLYMHWQRTFLQPMLANFDAPPREECTAARNVSNTPQQALTLLNDPTFVEAARVLAARLIEEKRSDATRIELLWNRVLGRLPANRELDSMLRLLTEQRRHYRADLEAANSVISNGLAPAPARVAATEIAAWTALCRVALNLHETITRY